MKKICIIFCSSEYNSWLDNNIISSLSTNYRLETVILNSNQNSVKTFNFEYGKPLKSMHCLYLLNQIAHLNGSKSFKFRLRRMYLGSINLSGSNLSSLEKIRGLFSTLKTFVGFSRTNYLQIVAFSRVPRIFLEFYYRKKFGSDLHKVQKSNKNFIKNLDADLIIFPTGGGDLLPFELLALCKLEKKDTMFVIENWDNLTSKTTFPFNPNFITVMGEKSALQAHSIHGFPLENIAITGLPRFQNYSENKKDANTRAINSNLKKILYLGYSLEYNEERIVKQIFSHLQDNYLRSNFELHYKPHPNRRKRFLENNIQVDKINNFSEIKIWKENSRTIKSLPLVNDDYLSFLRSFDIVISTPTTMALEVMLLDIPCIIDSLDDGIHITSPSYSMKKYLHLEDLADIPELKIAKTESEMLIYLDELMKSKTNFQNYSIKDIIETQQNFSTNLIAFLEKSNLIG